MGPLPAESLRLTLALSDRDAYSAPHLLLSADTVLMEWTMQT
jgi:hypothetical protein